MNSGYRNNLNETLPQAKVMRWGIGVAIVVLTLSLVVPAASQPVEVALTPLRPAATPPRDATPSLGATPMGRQVEDPGGVSSRLLGQQAAAQATIATYATREAAYSAREAAQATRIVALEAALSAVQVTATALVQVAASTVLDPNRQSIILQTDLDGMLGGDAEAVEQTRADLNRVLARFPPSCRAGFMLISGNAPSINEGVELAQRVEALLREVSPTIFPETTAAELFALPEQPPVGQVGIDVFFYAGCRPTE